MRHSYGLRHYLLRKRKGLEPDHHKGMKKFIDKLIYPIVFLGPIMTLPQLALVWIDKTAAGVSVIAWSTYTLTSLFWLAYGMIHKEKPIILQSAIWIVLNGLVAAGAYMYG